MERKNSNCPGKVGLGPACPFVFVGWSCLTRPCGSSTGAAGSTRFLDWRGLCVHRRLEPAFDRGCRLAAAFGAAHRHGGCTPCFSGCSRWCTGVMFNIFGEFCHLLRHQLRRGRRQVFQPLLLKPAQSLGGKHCAGHASAGGGGVAGAQAPTGGNPGGPGWLEHPGPSFCPLVSVVLLNRSLLPQADTMTWGSLFDPNSEEQAYKDFTDSNRCLLLAGLYQYTVRDFVVSFGLEASPVDLNSLDQFYEERAGQVSGENEYTGLYEGKSLLMVMLESIDTWLLTPEYMPNLYAFAAAGHQLCAQLHAPVPVGGHLQHGVHLPDRAAPLGDGALQQHLLHQQLPLLPGPPVLPARLHRGLFSTRPAPGFTAGGSIHQNLGMTYPQRRRNGHGRPTCWTAR